MAASENVVKIQIPAEDFPLNFSSACRFFEFSFISEDLGGFCIGRIDAHSGEIMARPAYSETWLPAEVCSKNNDKDMKHGCGAR